MTILDNLKRLSNEQLRECRYDARAMIAIPGNGIEEYRLAIIREENRRWCERKLQQSEIRQ